MKDFFKFCKHFFFFIIAFSLFYLVLLFALSNVTFGGKRIVYRAVQGMVWKGGYTFERFKEFDRNKKYDIIVLGSSRANRGLCSQPFEDAGLSFYNLGTDDQTPFNTNVIARQYINQHNCRLVIFDAYDKVFCQNPLESTSDLIQNMDNDCAAMQMAVQSKDLRSLNCFGIRMLLKNEAPEYKAETDLINGFRSDNEQYHYSFPSYSYYPVKEHLAAFDALLTYLEEIHVPCIVLMQPLPTVPVKYKLFINDIKPILKRHHVPFFDNTTNISLVSIDGFADASHFNTKGALIYSTYICNTIVQPFFKNVNASTNERVSAK
jgi:hypothetical protein